MSIPTSAGAVPLIPSESLRTFSLVIYIFSAVVSLIAFLFGIYVIYLDRHIWRSLVYRTLVLIQALNFFRFVIRPIAVFADVYAEFGCRALLFLNNVSAVLPIYLCVYCVLYLQIIVIHRVNPNQRWPRVVLLTVSLACSIIPQVVYMALPRKATGIPDFCNYPVVPSTHAYIVIIFCTALWVYFCGVVGAISITMTAIHIIRTTRVTKNMTQLSRATYGLSREPKRRGSTEILNTTLVAIVWFPITPIISLWLNMILISVHYYKKRVYMWTEYVNVALLALQSILMAVALVVNPSVRGVFRERRRKIRMGKQALTGVTRGSRLSHELYNVASSNATTMSSLLGLE